MFTLTDDGLTFDVTVQGLSGPITVAHFHNNIAGMIGPVVRTIHPSFVGNTATGVWTKTDAEPLTPTLIADLLAGRLYVNVHTAANPGGRDPRAGAWPELVRLHGTAERRQRGAAGPDPGHGDRVLHLE